MFVKPCLKQNITTGERYIVHKLVEAYHDKRQVIHRIILNPGLLDELETDDEKNSWASGWRNCL